jgi:hypothetical protein
MKPTWLDLARPASESLWLIRMQNRRSDRSRAFSGRDRELAIKGPQVRKDIETGIKALAIMMDVVLYPGSGLDEQGCLSSRQTDMIIQGLQSAAR